MVERSVYGIVGFWILLSPWLLGYSDFSIPKWSSILCGLLLVLMSAWSLFGEKQNKINKGQS